jgi:hypothetical protein
VNGLRFWGWSIPFTRPPNMLHPGSIRVISSIENSVQLNVDSAIRLGQFGSCHLVGCCRSTTAWNQLSMCTSHCSLLMTVMLCYQNAQAFSAGFLGATGTLTVTGLPHPHGSSANGKDPFSPKNYKLTASILFGLG